MQSSDKDCKTVMAITQFQSLMHAGWYTIMTMTTVGYALLAGVDDSNLAAINTYVCLLNVLVRASCHT
jgi:hypothetical protein